MRTLDPAVVRSKRILGGYANFGLGKASGSSRSLTGKSEMTRCSECVLNTAKARPSSGTPLCL